MLVLLVSDDAVVVDDARPAPDGEPPSHLLFDGPLVVVANRKYPGPDVVYRLVDRADLVGAYGRDIVQSPLAPSSHLAELRALPVYLQLSDDAARAWREATVTGHPVASVPTPRPHLQLAPPVERMPVVADQALDHVVKVAEGGPVPPPALLNVGLDGGDPFCLWCGRAGLTSPHAHESDDHPTAVAGMGIGETFGDGGPPTFSMDGAITAIGLGALQPGSVIRLAGLEPDSLNGPYVVGVVRPHAQGVDCDMLPLVDRPGVDAGRHLRREAERARAAAEDLRSTDPERALELIEAAAAYERHATRVAAARTGL